MNKVIKFRVWDKSIMKMHKVGDDIHDSYWIDENDHFQYRNLQNGEGSGEDGDYELMEFIGRKDEEETDIYESDVVQIIEQGHQLGFYYENEFLGIVKYSEETCSYFLDLIKFERGGEPIPDEIDGIPIHHGDDDEVTEYWFSDYIVPDDIRVLGNIYENPDLFEGVTK